MVLINGSLSGPDACVCVCGARPGIIVCNVTRLIIFPEQVMRATQCLHRAHFTVHQLKNEELQCSCSVCLCSLLSNADLD